MMAKIFLLPYYYDNSFLLRKYACLPCVPLISLNHVISKKCYKLLLFRHEGIYIYIYVSALWLKHVGPLDYCF